MGRIRRRMVRVKQRVEWLVPFKDFHKQDEFCEEDYPYDFSDGWLYEDLDIRLEDLRKYKCQPSLYLRGKKWRVYINSGTNIWEESERLDTAFRKAFKLWKKSGMPTACDSAVVLYVKERTYKKEHVCYDLEWRIV